MLHKIKPKVWEWTDNSLELFDWFMWFIYCHSTFKIGRILRYMREKLVIVNGVKIVSLSKWPLYPIWKIIFHEHRIGRSEAFSLNLPSRSSPVGRSEAGKGSIFSILPSRWSPVICKELFMGNSVSASVTGFNLLTKENFGTTLHTYKIIYNTVSYLYTSV